MSLEGPCSPLLPEMDGRILRVDTFADERRPRRTTMSEARPIFAFCSPAT